MFGREIIAIGATGAVSIFFLILIAYAAYGVVICFAEDSTLTNFKNFAISNVVLIIMGAIFFGIGLICLYLVFRAGGFFGCDKVAGGVPVRMRNAGGGAAVGGAAVGGAAVGAAAAGLFRSGGRAGMPIWRGMPVMVEEVGMRGGGGAAVGEDEDGGRWGG